MPAPLCDTVEDVQRVIDELYDKAGLSGQGSQSSTFDAQGFMPGDYKWTASTLAQPGWLDCDGVTYNVSQYPSLAKALGATGTTFVVPEVRGRTLVAAGTGPGLTARVLGTPGGSEPSNMPSHNHAGINKSFAGQYSGGAGNYTPIIDGNDPAGSAIPWQTGFAGGGADNMMPFIGARLLIKT